MAFGFGKKVTGTVSGSFAVEGSGDSPAFTAFFTARFMCPSRSNASGSRSSVQRHRFPRKRKSVARSDAISLADSESDPAAA